MQVLSKRTYLISTSQGVRSAIFWKSSMERSMSAARAMANKWRTEFVEPPMMLTMVIALMKDWRVRISLVVVST